MIMGLPLHPLTVEFGGLPVTLSTGAVKAGIIAVLWLCVALIGGYYDNWYWTGFGPHVYGGKSLWDWMQLLLIPLVLLVVGLLFNHLQSASQERQADQRIEEDRKLAEQRAITEREIAADNQREATLQTYLDNISALLLDEQLRTSQKDAEIRSVARTRTLSALRRLDGERKGTLVQFLHESQLISGTTSIIDLGGADLTGANLFRANLTGAEVTTEQLDSCSSVGGATMPDGSTHN